MELNYLKWTIRYRKTNNAFSHGEAKKKSIWGSSNSSVGREHTGSELDSPPL